MKIFERVFIGGAALAIAACVHDGGYETAEMHPERGEIIVKAGVTIVEDGKGGFDFKYKSAFSDEEGNFDFSRGEAFGKSVLIEFKIVKAPEGLHFMPKGRDAIWIADKRSVGRSGSPEAVYVGNQFTDFSVDEGGMRLTLKNVNDDEVLYRYGLRFELDGNAVNHDPDMQNGGHG